MGSDVTGGTQQTQHHFRISHVHLASVRLDVRLARAGRDNGRRSYVTFTCGGGGPGGTRPAELDQVCHRAPIYSRDVGTRPIRPSVDRSANNRQSGGTAFTLTPPLQVRDAVKQSGAACLEAR